MDSGFFNNLRTKIHKVFTGSEKIPSVDDAWLQSLLWESITSVNIEVLFKTIHLRKQQVAGCNRRSDMPIPHGGIRQLVQAGDSRLKILKYLLDDDVQYTNTLLTNQIFIRFS